MLLTLMLFSAFLIGIGLIFTLIDLRTRFGPQFRNFSVCLAVMPGAALLDLFSFADWTGPETRLLLQRLLHLYVLPFTVFSAHYLPKVAGRRSRPMVTAVFAAGALVLAPIFLTDAFLRLEGGAVRGGPAYPFTFLLYGTAYILFAYIVLICHVRTAGPGEKRFARLHLIGFVVATGGGLMDMLAVVEPRLLVFPSCKSFGVLVFGIFCAYFFADRFFRILEERNHLFRQVEGLNQEFLRAQPLWKIGESTARISHEIRNYVSILKSNHLLLRNRLMPGPEDPEVDRMARSTERLESFAQSILDFSNSGHSLRFETLDLEALIRGCVENHFPGRSGDFPIRGPQEGLRVRGDRGRLEQVFVNLFRNSLEAGATRVSVLLERREPFAAVEIEDDGSGSPEQDHAMLGTPFFTSKRGAGGTGLGLAIAASILHGHEGNLVILPAPAPAAVRRGFKVRLVIPLPPDPGTARGCSLLPGGLP